MNIIIVGAGKVGSYVTSDLSNGNHDIVVIDKNKQVLNRLLAQNDVMGIEGDGRDPEVLREANVDRCDLFIALTMSDDVNLIASTLAKAMGAKNNIIRLRDPKYIRENDIITSITNASIIINPEFLAAKEIQRSLKYSHARNVESFLNDKAIMIEIFIEENSSLLGQKISDINELSAIDQIIIGIVSHEGQITIPHGDYILSAGEKIYLFGKKEGIDRFYKDENEDDVMIKDILIIGAGAISHYLTGLLLERGFNVTVIEIDRDKAISFKEDFSNAIVINADGSDPDVLEEVRVDSFDSLIALTGIDEENILISLIADRYDIIKSIAKVNRTKLLKFTGILDMDETITPKRSASNFINRILRSKENSRGQSIRNLYRLEEDLVEVIEFEIVEDSPMLNKKIKDLDIRKDTLLATIEHFENGEVEVVRGNSKLSIGDRVLVITTSTDFTSIEDILE